MARIALNFDEHVQIGLAEALRIRGVDVLTTQEAGNIGVTDIEQLAFAAGKGRSLFSYNKRHFAKIHNEPFAMLWCPMNTVVCWRVEKVFTPS